MIIAGKNIAIRCKNVHIQKRLPISTSDRKALSRRVVRFINNRLPVWVCLCVFVVMYDMYRVMAEYVCVCRYINISVCDDRNQRIVTGFLSTTECCHT